VQNAGVRLEVIAELDNADRATMGSYGLTDAGLKFQVASRLVAWLHVNHYENGH
jgi:hypothetical protein